jgi:aminopeptidase YwaD
VAADPLVEQAATYLTRLCLEIPSRRVGSPGNRAATDLFAATVASFGFVTETPSFACIDWRSGSVQLVVDGLPFAALASPYSLGCQVSASLVVASTVTELEALSGGETILLLHGEIAREQLMPKNFPFYQPEHHQHIIRLLETKQPRAIITATARDAVMVGAGVYPFPMIEDGDFDIPSVYMTDEEGRRLASHAGQLVSLTSRSERLPATGCNVIARTGPPRPGRVVVFAHIDAHIGTPGAIDNASGTIVLLLLAELLADYAGQISIELVALNGEDYFSNPGEQLYLAMNEDTFDEIVLGINIDGVGYRRGRIAYSLYECPAPLAGSIHTAFAAHDELVEGDPWYQGDHGLFLMRQRPALALTSELAPELMAEIVHTASDTPAVVDPARLVTAARALHALMDGFST